MIQPVINELKSNRTTQKTTLELEKNEEASLKPHPQSLGSSLTYPTDKQD